MEPIIGIDLGTTNSVVACMRDGVPVVIPNAEGEDLTPSVVAFTAAQPSGPDSRGPQSPNTAAKGPCRWVGKLAKAQALANPLRTVFSAKRSLGGAEGRVSSVECRVEEKAHDSSIDTRPSTLDPRPLTVVSSIKRQMGDSSVAIRIDGRDWSPVEISAIILGKLKADTESFLGQPVQRAVITVPAYFNDRQRRATSDAAAIAGLEVTRLVGEPTAAALAYGLDLDQAHTVLVWDLGGGTFDVSVLELGDGVFQVKAVSGDTRLGGDDYDARLADWLAERFRAEWRIDLGAADNSVGNRLLRQLAEEAKVRLSEAQETRVFLPHSFTPGNRCSLLVTRQELERLTADLTERMVSPTYQALADAKLDSSDLDAVVLVGGMTRMPVVRKLAREITGREPCGWIDPDKVVAMGAAIQAGVLAAGRSCNSPDCGTSNRESGRNSECGIRNAELKQTPASKNSESEIPNSEFPIPNSNNRLGRVTLVDVTALSLGIETQGGLFARVIERNTPIPTSRNKLFTNARDGQTAMDIRVLQGERELAQDNMLLGKFQLSGVTAQPRGQARAEVTFDIDANDIVQVSATDLQTEQSSSIRLTSASRPTAQAVEAALADSRRAIETDRRRREEVESAIRAGNMLDVAQEAVAKAVRLASSAATLPILPLRGIPENRSQNEAGKSAGFGAELSSLGRLADAVEESADQVRAALAAGDSSLILAGAAKLEAATKPLLAALQGGSARGGVAVDKADQVKAESIHEQFLG